MRILNLYCGIGGNRKLWGDRDITAVEFNKDIAEVYKSFYPNDNVIVGDAHEYLLKNYKDFDFIWSSPPCPSHSDIRRYGVHRGQVDAIYPEMSLYQEIILLQNFYNGLFVVENVKPYYEPLIPAILRARHLFWANFEIQSFDEIDNRIHNDIQGSSTVYGVNLNGFKIDNKRKILRNMVNPDLGLHVLNCALKIPQEKKCEQLGLFS